MNGITYWIQHAEFSGEDFPRVDLATAIGVFREYDWGGELQRQDARAMAGEEIVRPESALWLTDGYFTFAP